MNDAISSNHSDFLVQDQPLRTRKEGEKVLCVHCGRTQNNGIRCIGKCSDDDNY